MGRIKPGKTRRRRHDDLPPGIRIRESRPGEGTAFTDLAALAMEGHGGFDDREAMSETVDAGGPFISRFGAGRFLFLVAEHTSSGRIVGVSSSIPPLSVLDGMERNGADPVVLGATAMAHVKVRALSVADDYRRQGIASALVAKALASTVITARSSRTGSSPPVTPPWPGSTGARGSPFTPRVSRSFFRAAPGTVMSVPHPCPASRCSRARSRWAVRQRTGPWPRSDRVAARLWTGRGVVG
ncbi:hypothetical protein ACIA9I_21585 [Streptomyces anulatus]